MIDDIIKQLKSYKDADIRQRLEKDPKLMGAIVKEYFYCG